MSSEKNTIAYELGPATYINLTNRCTNDCTFCVRHAADGVGGYDLRLSDEPSSADVIQVLSEKKPQNVVFCGFGEPTIRLRELIDAARYAHSYGGKVRINTNGHANLIHGRNVVPELADTVDEVSISLNAADRDSYDEIAQCSFGPAGFDALIEFAKLCRDAGIDVTLSIVDVLGNEETARARRLADELGVKFRVRAYVD